MGYWKHGVIHHIRQSQGNETNRKSSKIVKVGGDVEEVNSFKYTLKLFDDKGSIIEIKAFGIDSISNKISPTNMKVIQDHFPECDINELNRPQSGTVDCLMGIEYAAFHPVKYHENDHMLLKKSVWHCN